MRPISSKFWGNFDENPNAVIFDKVWLPQKDAPSRNAFIIKQTGANRFLVEDQEGDQGEVSLTDKVESPGDAILKFVVPMDPDTVENSQMKTSTGPISPDLSKPKFVLCDPFNNICYMAHHAGAGPINGGVASYDVTDPENPILLDSVPAGWSVNMITQRGNFLFVDNNNNPQRIQCIDVSDPSNMTLISSSPGSSGQLFGHTADDQGNIAFGASATGSGLKVYDFTNKLSPTELPNSINFNAGGVAYTNNHVYITNYSTNRVTKYDVSDPSNPVQVTQSQPLGSFLVGIVFEEGYLFAADYNGSTTYILDPENLNLISSVTVPGIVPQIAGGAHYNSRRKQLLVQYGQNSVPGLTVFDMTDVSNPVEITNKPLPGLNETERGDIIGDQIYMYKRNPAPEELYVGKVPTLDTLNINKIHSHIIKTSQGAIYGWELSDTHQFLDLDKITKD